MTEQALQTAPDQVQKTDPMAFSFGDAESVIDSRELSAYFEIWHNGKWFEPPLPLSLIHI